MSGAMVNGYPELRDFAVNERGVRERYENGWSVVRYHGSGMGFVREPNWYRHWFNKGSEAGVRARCNIPPMEMPPDPTDRVELFLATRCILCADLVSNNRTLWEAYNSFQPDDLTRTMFTRRLRGLSAKHPFTIAARPTNGAYAVVGLAPAEPPPPYPIAGRKALLELQSQQDEHERIRRGELLGD